MECILTIRMLGTGSCRLVRRGVLVAGTLTSAHTIRMETSPGDFIEQIDMALDRLEDTINEN
jgi:hypothetical protein